jgi:hypothetical protein
MAPVPIKDAFSHWRSPRPDVSTVPSLLPVAAPTPHPPWRRGGERGVEACLGSCSRPVIPGVRRGTRPKKSGTLDSLVRRGIAPSPTLAPQPGSQAMQARPPIPTPHRGCHAPPPLRSSSLLALSHPSLTLSLSHSSSFILSRIDIALVPHPLPSSLFPFLERHHPARLYPASGYDASPAANSEPCPPLPSVSSSRLAFLSTKCRLPTFQAWSLRPPQGST